MSATFSFRPAVRERVGLLIGLIGPSGSGKTFTAMRLASGIAAASGTKPPAVIDTEAGRAKHYADLFRFDHGDLTPPFRPGRYLDAIVAADQAGYPAIVVDSFSHEHAGEGGLLDWHEEELQRMAGEDGKRREAVTMAAWIKPKMAHKAMIQRLLQVRAHLILCFRAEEKVEMVRNKDTGKMEVVPKRTLGGFSGWIPVCEKSLPYELTVSLLLSPERPGVPLPIKLQAQHRALFPDGHEVTEKSGEQLAGWAQGRRTESPRGGEEPAAAAPESTGGPQPSLIGTEEAHVLLGRIKGGFDKCRIGPDDQRALWGKYCGGAAFMSGHTDVALLQDLLAELQRRFKAGGK